MSTARSIESISTDIYLHVFVQHHVAEEQITQLLELSDLQQKWEKSNSEREASLRFCQINSCDAGILKGFPFCGDWSCVLWFSAQLPALSGTNGREYSSEFPVCLSYILLFKPWAILTRAWIHRIIKLWSRILTQKWMYVRQILFWDIPCKKNNKFVRIRSKGLRMTLSFIKWNIRM